MSNGLFNVLVVDDNEDFRKILNIVLSNAGIHVFEATNGAEALAILENNIDLIICDIMMPEMDGFSFLKELRKNYSREIPLIFISASSTIEDQLKGFELEADDYIVKPFEPAILIAKINSQLKKRKYYLDNYKKDQLTGLLNRNSFYEESEKAIYKYRNGSFIFIDLDNFKFANDNYGHKFGDNILIQFSNFLREHCRKIDLYGRYGGEEFVVFLPETNYLEADIWTERLLKDFKSISYLDYKCSFSAGISEFPTHGEDIDLLCALADKAMYQAKAQGKGRVVVYNSLQSLPQSGHLAEPQSFSHGSQ